MLNHENTKGLISAAVIRTDCSERTAMFLVGAAILSGVTAPLTTAHSKLTAVVATAVGKLWAAGFSRRTAHHTRRTAARAAASLTLWATAAIRAANPVL